MKKSTMKLIAAVLTLAMAISCLTACGNNVATEPTGTSEPTATTAVTAAATDKPSETVATSTPTPTPMFTDLGGMEIIIADWWTTDESEPTTAKEEATRDYRNQIMADYNFTIKQTSIGGWGDHKETFILSTMAGKPKGQIFIMDQSFVATPLLNGLFYDLATLEAFDFTESKWNKDMINLMSRGDSIYGMRAGKSEPRLGIFWNKRMFEDAGLEPDLLYDLQESGEWTWDKFYEICSKLTRDIDSDGVTDVYALASFSVDFFKACAVSNMANFIDVDDNGNYYNATGEPNFLEAAQWGVSIIDAGFVMPKAEDAKWDWFIAAFHDTNVAMTVAEEYKVSNWADMQDDFGFVMFPKGPKADQYMTVFADNIEVIPSCYDKETAEKIAFAYNLYTNPTPGYEDDDDWTLSYYSKFRDERAVDETLTLMFKEGSSLLYYLPLIDGLSYGDFAYSVYARAATPQEKIEELAGTWQSILDDINGK